jgi:tRNA threonylcarbamoyladenosine biosynthesis protein TsaB
VLLLALDSADATCSAALWDSARPAAAALLGERRSAATRGGQADHLIALIDDLVRALDIDYRALGLLAVNHGPGSFTGIRTAVAAARGLALAADLPLLAVGSLEALAAAVPAGPGTLLAALDARRGQVYVQTFNRQKQPGSAPALRSPRQAVADLPAGPLRLVGSGAGLIRAELPADRAVAFMNAEPSARWVARRAAERLASGETPQDGATLHPLYLRPPDARPQTPLVAPARAQAVEA